MSKYDLRCVYLIPQRSPLTTRRDCDPSSCGADLPIISSPMDTVYSTRLDKTLTDFGVPVVVHRYFDNPSQQLQHSCGAEQPPGTRTLRYFAVGQDTAWISFLYRHGVRAFCCDFAHGDSRPCTDTIKFIKGFSDTKVIAGNVATGDGFRRLEEAGADMIRVGIGCGSFCTTRYNTGFYVPLLKSLEDAAKARKWAKIIADGGIWLTGDIAKCIKYGADLCMLGRVLAATTDSSAEKLDAHGNLAITGDEIHSVVYRGMASREARRNIKSHASVEGMEDRVPFLGDTYTLLKDMLLNLQASLSYAGALTWDEFRPRVKVGFTDSPPQDTLPFHPNQGRRV